MKVWEKCNEVKGTKATMQEIANWAWDNKICPLMFDVGLELDLPLDEDAFPVENGFIKTARKVCSKSKCDYKCLIKYLESEYDEVTENE